MFQRLMIIVIFIACLTVSYITVDTIHNQSEIVKLCLIKLQEADARCQQIIDRANEIRVMNADLQTKLDLMDKQNQQMSELVFSLQSELFAEKYKKLKK